MTDFNVRNLNQLWNWVDSHSESEFWSVYNRVSQSRTRYRPNPTSVPMDVWAGMQEQADYLLSANESMAVRAESNFGC